MSNIYIGQIWYKTNQFPKVTDFLDNVHSDIDGINEEISELRIDFNKNNIILNHRIYSICLETMTMRPVIEEDE